MKEAYLPFWVSSATLRSHLHRCPPFKPCLIYQKHVPRPALAW